MTNKNPAALRLAEDIATDAVLEIRRLHEVNQELLEALKWAVDCLHFDYSMPEAMANLDNAYAVLAKAIRARNDK